MGIFVSLSCTGTFTIALHAVMYNYRFSLLRTQRSYSLKPWICINGTQQQNLVFQILKNKIHPCARFYFILFYFILFYFILVPVWLLLVGPLLMSTLLRWFYIVSNWHLKLTMTPPSNAISSGTKAPHLLLLLSINFFSNQPIGDGGNSFGCGCGSSYCQLIFFLQLTTYSGSRNRSCLLPAPMFLIPKRNTNTHTHTHGAFYFNMP